MKFLYPLGFLALIAIPILVAIYILKNKYTEQTISSTYIWTLSEKFIKRRNLLSRIVGIISLILQILAVIFIAFAAAHPVITVANSAETYCFILDGSGSMNMVQDGSTRFQKAKEDISSKIRSSKEGSVFTLILAGEDAEIVYEDITDKKQAKNILATVEATHLAQDTDKAVKAAQDYFSRNPSCKTCLYTDKAYESVQNIELINLAKPVGNFALSGAEAYLDGGKLKIEGKAISYESDETLTIRAEVNGKKPAEKIVNISVGKLQFAPYSIEIEGIEEFDSVTLSIEQADALDLDSTLTIFSREAANSYSALIISDNAFYIRTLFNNFPNVKTYIVETAKYSSQSGYDLYIFDGYTPEALPADGAVWFFNPVGSVEGAGFTYQNVIEEDVAAKLEYSSSSSTFVSTLLKGVNKTPVSVKKYVKCGTHRNFTTLMTHNGNPVVFVGSNDLGNREAVFSFDLHDTPFALYPDFITLSYNLLNYMFPSTIDGLQYYCGESMLVNIPSGCDSVTVKSPSGKTSFLDTDYETGEYTLSEVGVYTVTVAKGETAKTYGVFSALPEEERTPTVTESSFSVVGEPSAVKRNGIFDILLYIVILLAVVAAADWMVYCYEQYQLR